MVTSPVAWIALFAAGGLGACLRVVMSAAIDARGVGPSHAGTLVVNLLGCFAIGLLGVVLAKHAWRPVVVAGLLGGFTTYSSFAMISFELGRAGRASAALLQIGAHVLGGLLAVALGVWLGELIAPAAE